MRGGNGTVLQSFPAGSGPGYKPCPDVADGRSWEFICNERWEGRIPLAAVAEAVKMAQDGSIHPTKISSQPLRYTGRLMKGVASGALVARSFS